MFSKTKSTAVSIAPLPASPLQHPQVVAIEQQSAALSAKLSAARAELEASEESLAALRRRDGRALLAQIGEGTDPANLQLEGAIERITVARRRVAVIEEAAKTLNTDARAARQRAIEEAAPEVDRFLANAERGVVLATIELRQAIEERQRLVGKLYDNGYVSCGRPVPFALRQIVSHREAIDTFIRAAIVDGLITADEGGAPNVMERTQEAIG